MSIVNGNQPLVCVFSGVGGPVEEEEMTCTEVASGGALVYGSGTKIVACNSC